MIARASKGATTAILLFLYVMLGNACTLGIVRHLTSLENPFHVFQIVCLTNFLGALGFLPWLMKGGKQQIATAQFKLFSLRAVLEFVAFSAIFYAVTLIPLPTQTAISFMTPVFATLIALTILKEHGTWVTYLSIAGGFGGMLIITQPNLSAETFNVGILFVLFAAMIFASCGSIIKILTRTEPSDRIAFYMLSMTALIAAPFAIAHWQTPTADVLPWFLALGAIAFTIQQAVAAALSRVPFMTLIPLNFVQLVFVSTIALVFFDEQVTGRTIIGSILILASTLLNGWYSARHTREMAAKQDLAQTAA